MLCVLLARNPRRSDGTEMASEEAARLLFERGPASMRALCATVSDSDLRSSPANRILDVDQSTIGQAQAKKWLLNLDPLVRDQVLTSHAIEPDSLELLKESSNDKFLRRRMKYISRIERDFMQEVHVTPPETDDPAPSPIDADDSQPL